MRAFTLKTEIVAVDKASKSINTISNAATRMSKTMLKESAISNISFNKFISGVGVGVKKASFHLNNLNAKINSVGRNIKNKLGGFGLAIGFAAASLVIGNTIAKFADFEQANSNLSAVMASATDPELKALQIDAKRLGAITAKTSTEVVGLQESLARLGFETPDIINMTQSVISGSVAMQGELSATAELVGAMVKSFDQFESINTPQIIDQMTTATQKSALNFEKLQTALPVVAGAANIAGIPFNKLLALLGKLSDAGIDASSSSTALRNIILQSAKAGMGYEDILGNIVKNQDKLTMSMDKFGVRAAVPAAILAGKLNETLTLSEDILNGVGSAAAAEAKQLDNLRGVTTILGSAWEGYILSVEDGNGSIGNFLKDSVRMATEILSIATGTQKAESEMTKAELRIRSFANIGIKLLKVIKTIVIAFVAFKVVMIALRSAIFAYNIALGIMGALSGTASIAIGSSTVALNAYKIASGLATAATWLFSAALWANPITWIVVGIIALIAVIILLVKNWDKVTAAIKKVWDQFKNTEFIQNIIEKFKAFMVIIKPLIDWMKKVGSVIKEYIIDKFRQVSEFIGKIIDKVQKFFGKEDESVITGGAVKKEIEISSSTNNAMVVAMENNTAELAKNTNATKDGWVGKFTTSILKDANISERTSGIAQRELATSAIVNEKNITNTQKDVIESSAPKSVITQNSEPIRRSKSGNEQITINLVDKTGGKFALEVESTGIEVITTGNG